MTLSELGLPEFEIIRGDQKYIFKNYTLLAYNLERGQWVHFTGIPNNCSYTREGVQFLGLFRTQKGTFILLEHDMSRQKKFFLQEPYSGYTIIKQKYTEFPHATYDNMSVKVMPRDQLITIKEVE